MPRASYRPTVGLLSMSYGMEQIPDREKNQKEEEVRGSKWISKHARLIRD